MFLLVQKLKSFLGIQVCILAALIVFSYLPSFPVPFIFDDTNHISHNPRIQNIVPLWRPLLGTNRPVVDFSLAVNFALGKYHVWGYHLFNLFIHIAAAVILLLIFRVTLSCYYCEKSDKGKSSSLAFMAVLIWALHPLQTESVTYIIQRSESLMGLFYLLTLYCLTKSIQTYRSRLWGMLAVIFCALGMATKEVMVTAPLLAIIYDRIFFTGSFKEIFRKRGGIYLSMALTWILLVYFVTVTRTNNTNAGMSLPGVSPFAYLIAQQKVLARYLKLAIWPNDLCFDYCWALPKTVEEVAPFSLIVVFLLGLTVWSLVKKPVLGFWGLWFFLILAPTSSIFPIGDLVVEHRMYLPLAGVSWLLIVAIDKLCSLVLCRTSFVILLPLFPRWGARKATLKNFTDKALGTWTIKQKEVLVLFISISIVIGLSITTVRRNQLYQNEEALWRDTLLKGNETDRGHLNLGVALFHNGKWAEAKEHLLTAARFNPADSKIYFNLGLISLGEKDSAAADRYFQKVFELRPDFEEGYYNAGLVYFQRNEYERASYYFRKAVAQNPLNVKARFNLATTWANMGKYLDAAKELEEVIRMDPMFPDAKRRLQIIQSLIPNQQLSSPVEAWQP